MYSVNMHQRKQKKRRIERFSLTLVIYFLLFGIFGCHIAFDIQTHHFRFGIRAKGY